jgi:serine/threonine protein kinase
VAESYCPTREQLLAYHVGELPEDCAKAMIGHLSDCAVCPSRVRTFEDAPESPLGLLQLHAAGHHDYLCEPQCRAAVAIAQSIVEASLQTEHPRTLGDYDLLETLGEGGMGTVYKARHAKLNRIVALKVIKGRLGNPRAGARFEQEMNAVGRLLHPHIVRADDARDIDGTPMLVMEYIDGLDLARLVELIGPLPIADACEMVRQAALGLQAVDEAKLVHRDIKPSNVIVSREGHVKILDLGLALLCTEQSASPGLTHSGDAVGSADYIAPEQIEDSHHVDIRADLYSLGCTLYHLLTGQPPFAGPRFSSRLDKLVAHREHCPPPLDNWRDEVPDELVTLLDGLLAKDPTRRPSTPAELAETLATFAAGANLPALVSRAMQQVPAESTESHTGTEDQRSACGNTPPNDVRAPNFTSAGGPTRLVAPRIRRWLPAILTVSVLLAACGIGLHWHRHRVPAVPRPGNVSRLQQPPSFAADGGVARSAPPAGSLPKVSGPSSGSGPSPLDSGLSALSPLSSWPEVTGLHLPLDAAGRAAARGVIEQLDETDWYEVTSLRTGRLLVSVVPESSDFAPQLTLYRGRAQGVDRDAGDDGEARVELDVTQGERIVCAVTSLRAESHGPYALTATHLSAPSLETRATAGILTFDAAGRATARGYISRIDQEHWYTWTVPRSGQLAIRAETIESSLDTHLEFYDGKALVAEHDNIIDRPVTAGVRYWLRLRVNQPVTPRNMPHGNYTIQIDLEPRAQGPSP